MFHTRSRKRGESVSTYRKIAVSDRILQLWGIVGGDDSRSVSLWDKRLVPVETTTRGVLQASPSTQLQDCYAECERTLWEAGRCHIVSDHAPYELSNSARCTGPRLVPTCYRYGRRGHTVAKCEVPGDIITSVTSEDTCNVPVRVKTSPRDKA